MGTLRRHIHILLSTGGEREIAQCLVVTFERYLRERYDVHILEVPSAREYLTHAARQPFDAFIVLLNNMIPDAGDLFPKNEALNAFPAIKVDQALQILSFLKQTYRKPVLALTGWWPDNWDVASKVKSHSLDYFGFIPPDGQSLATALGRCL